MLLQSVLHVLESFSSALVSHVDMLAHTGRALSAVLLSRIYAANAALAQMKISEIAEALLELLRPGGIK